MADTAPPAPGKKSERTWTNPRYDIYQEQGEIFETKGMNMRETFELCGRGTWKKFQSFLEDKGIREGALFLKGEEGVMEEILLFFKEHKQVNVKYQALCLAAASKTVHVPAPYPDKVNLAARNRLNIEAEQLRNFETRITSSLKTLDDTLNKARHLEVIKECKYQVELTKDCLDLLVGDDEAKNGASGKFMKTTKSMEGLFKKTVQDLQTATDQFEAAVVLFGHEITVLSQRLPQRRKIILLYKIAMGADHDFGNENWTAMGIQPSDFERLGDFQIKKGVVKKSPTIRNAKFPYLDLTGVNLRGLTFSHCDLSKVKLGVDLQEITFKHCVFGSKFALKDRNLTNSSFEGCDLSGVSFEGAILKKSRFIFAKLARCDFRNVTFYEVDMRHSHLEAANFEGCDLSDSLLHDAILEKATLINIIPPKNLDNAKLGGAVLNSVDLRTTSIRNVDFFGASLVGTILPENTDFRAFNLEGTDMTGAVVTNCRFDHTDLTKTILNGIKATGCSFVGAKLPSNTEWGECSDCAFDNDDTAVDVCYQPQARRNRISAARNYAAAVTKDGNVHVWGSHFSTTPLRAPAAEVAATDDFCMALLEDGTVQVWNDRGMRVDIGLEDWSDIETIRGGRNKIVGVTKAGKVKAWRAGVSSNPPLEVARVAKIAVGGDHVLALLFNGGVVGWGSNEHGQCNIPAMNEAAVSVAAGAHHSVAVLESGKVLAWGLNNAGQASPPPIFNATDAACGTDHSIALTSNSTIIGWGNNTVNQIPHMAVNVAAIAAGDYFSVTLHFDGMVRAWGSTDEGDISMATPTFPFARLP